MFSGPLFGPGPRVWKHSLLLSRRRYSATLASFLHPPHWLSIFDYGCCCPRCLRPCHSQYVVKDLLFFFTFLFVRYQHISSYLSIILRPRPQPLSPILFIKALCPVFICPVGSSAFLRLGMRLSEADIISSLGFGAAVRHLAGASGIAALICKDPPTRVTMALEHRAAIEA